MNLFITPHPPIIISEIGKGEEKRANDTVLGMQKIAKDVAKIKPKIIAIITPHGNVFSDALCINIEEKLNGDFSDFGYHNLSYDFMGSEKAKIILKKFNDSGIACIEINKKSAKQYNISTKIDHGALVPLHFITKEYSDFELIHINIGFLSKTQIYKAGEIFADILGEDNVLISSGDLSHRLTSNAPSGYDSAGQIYDDLMVGAIKNKRYIDILEVDENILERAGQCAQKPFEMLIGALEGYDTKTDVYSYEGPFGVGYMTAKIERKEKNGVSILDEFLKNRKEDV